MGLLYSVYYEKVFFIILGEGTTELIQLLIFRKPHINPRMVLGYIPSAVPQQSINSQKDRQIDAFSRRMDRIRQTSRQQQYKFLCVVMDNISLFFVGAILYLGKNKKGCIIIRKIYLVYVAMSSRIFEQIYIYTESFYKEQG